MNVLHIYRTYFPETQGGLEETIRQVCSSTMPLGISARVLTTTRQPTGDVIQRQECDVYRVKQDFEVASCNVAFSMFTEFRELSAWADILHYHFPWPFADLLHLASPPDKPAIVTYHSDIVRQRLLSRIYAPLMSRFLDSMDRIVCTSPNYLESSQVLKKYRDKVEVIPIGISESSYDTPSAQDRDDATREFGDSFFLFVGVLRYYKGLDFLLDAAAGAPFRVVIAGKGPAESHLLRKARSRKLPNVVFAGHVSNRTKMALLAACRGVVLPSHLRSEAFGVTLLEGAMSAKPLISTEIGTGTSFINVDGHTGFVVAPSSARALRDAMDQMWHDPRGSELMGANARSRYERLFTGAAMGRAYAHLYESVTNSRLPAT